MPDFRSIAARVGRRDLLSMNDDVYVLDVTEVHRNADGSVRVDGVLDDRSARLTVTKAGAKLNYFSVDDGARATSRVTDMRILGEG